MTNIIQLRKTFRLSTVKCILLIARSALTSLGIPTSSSKKWLIIVDKFFIFSRLHFKHYSNVSFSVVCRAKYLFSICYALFFNFSCNFKNFFLVQNLLNTFINNSKLFLILKRFLFNCMENNSVNCLESFTYDQTYCRSSKGGHLLD